MKKCNKFKRFGWSCSRCNLHVGAAMCMQMLFQLHSLYQWVVLYCFHDNGSVQQAECEVDLILHPNDHWAERSAIQLSDQFSFKTFLSISFFFWLRVCRDVLTILHFRPPKAVCATLHLTLQYASIVNIPVSFYLLIYFLFVLPLMRQTDTFLASDVSW